MNMAKWYGNIGFTNTMETDPGIWEDEIVERPYFGDVINEQWKRQPSGGVNDDINVANRISIVADPYAMDHCSTITYVEFIGAKWKVSDINVQYPRLILNLGGIWNG
jgi:hypothetical protein